SLPSQSSSTPLPHCSFPSFTTSQAHAEISAPAAGLQDQFSSVGQSVTASQVVEQTAPSAVAIQTPLTQSPARSHGSPSGVVPCGITVSEQPQAKSEITHRALTIAFFMEMSLTKKIELRYAPTTDSEAN